MFGINGEGVQGEKVPFFQFIGRDRTILDLGCGIMMPYAPFLLERNPHHITFLDFRFVMNSQSRFVTKTNLDAFKYLDLSNSKFDYIWASEFLEHIDPDKQEELMDKIVKNSMRYIITFPTTEHFNFHNDWSHRPVIVPHWAYKVNDNDWEGIITNVPEIINLIKSKYETKFLDTPPRTISKKREEKGLEV